MKLSEILKDWPEKKEYQSTMVNPADVIYNTALESCDREIDREALAKVLMDIMYGGHHKWSLLHEDQRQQFEFEAAEIISTMPTWLKPTERK